MEKIYIKIDKKLDVGTNEIEFTPQEEGEYIYFITYDIKVYARIKSKINSCKEKK